MMLSPSAANRLFLFTAQYQNNSKYALFTITCTLPPLGQSLIAVFFLVYVPVKQVFFKATVKVLNDTRQHSCCVHYLIVWLFLLIHAFD